MWNFLWNIKRPYCLWSNLYTVNPEKRIQWAKSVEAEIFYFFFRSELFLSVTHCSAIKTNDGIRTFTAYETPCIAAGILLFKAARPFVESEAFLKEGLRGDSLPYTPGCKARKLSLLYTPYPRAYNSVQSTVLNCIFSGNSIEISRTSVSLWGFYYQRFCT